MFVSNGAVVLKTPFSAQTTSSWFPSMPPMSGGWPSAYGAIYRRQLWVYVVVSKRARATARLPLPVYRHDKQDRPRVDDHPMALLLANPNPGLSGFGLWLWTSSTFDIYGEAFWLKKRRAGTVAALFPLHPSSMSYNAEDGTWRFDNGKKVIDPIAESDLVHFRAFDPESQTCGMSPLEPLRSTLENEWNARNATSSFWRNGARPGYALSHPGNLSQAAADRLRAQWDATAGGSGNTGKTVVLEEGMKPETLTLTAEEAQYIETRKLNREEVCAAYDIPPPVVHILDHATFSNITEQMRSMYRDTMAPHLKGLESTLETDLRLAEWPNDDVYAEFLMDEVLRGDFEARQEALSKADHMTIAEKRKVENLPFIPGTDRIFLNTATLPLDAIDAQAAANVAAASAPPPTPAPTEVPDNVIPLPTARSVMGRLAWQRSFDDVDPDALTRDLTGSHRAMVLRAYRAELGAPSPTVDGLRGRLRVLGKAAAPADHAGEVETVLRAFFKRQGASVLSAADLSARWDKELSDDLHAVALQVSEIVGKGVVKAGGFDPDTYNVEQTVNYLRAVTDSLAEGINTTTRGQLAKDGADQAAVFQMAQDSRAAGIAVGVTTLVSGFAATEAGKQASAAHGAKPTKTWVTGSNPRAAHAAMDGETVDIESEFSDGSQWPGQGADSAGCNCSVDISF